MPGDGRLAGDRRGRCEPLAGDVLVGVANFGGGRQVRLRLALRRAVGRGAQEPACRRGRPGPVIVGACRLGVRWLGVCRLGACRLGVRWLGVRWLGVRWLGVRWLGVRWLGVQQFGVCFRAGGLGRDQARWHRPGRHDAIRPDSTRGVRTLRFFGKPGLLVTILTRSITFCAHHRPQFSHVSGEISPPSPDLYLFVRVLPGSMLPIESESVQRAIIRAGPDPSAHQGVIV
jgi:hypothetical protein